MHANRPIAKRSFIVSHSTIWEKRKSHDHAQTYRLMINGFLSQNEEVIKANAQHFANTGYGLYRVDGNYEQVVNFLTNNPNASIEAEDGNSYGLAKFEKNPSKFLPPADRLAKRVSEETAPSIKRSRR